MDSEETYEVLRNEGKVEIRDWSEEVKGWFIKCATDGMIVEFMAGSCWHKAPPQFYSDIQLYTRSSAIFRVLF